MKTPTRIVIVGGGISGLLLATKLGSRYKHSGDATVTLVDRGAAHIWKPMLHTVAAGTTDVGQQRVLYIAHAREHGYVYQPGAMCGLDRSTREVHISALNGPDGEPLLGERSVPYDLLILSVGSQANDFGTPGVAEHCHFIDNLGQAEHFNDLLRARVFRSVTRDEPLRIAIVGGGATGVELSAELSRMLEVASGFGDPRVRERLDLTLLESGPRVLASFPESISASSEALLGRMGLHVKTSTRVTSADATGFHYGDNGRIDADLMVWAAGVKAPDFMNGLGGLQTTKHNQILIRPTLQSLDDDAIFVLGDCASLTPQGNSKPLPPTAQVATQQAEHLAKHLPDHLEANKPLPDFSFHNFGSLVSLADYDAYGTLGQFGFFRGGVIRGRLAEYSHDLLYRRHQQALHGFWRATLLWLAEKINNRVQPRIKLA
jgi:NADH:ubiquinone reductase (H+-translocating)